MHKTVTFDDAIKHCKRLRALLSVTTPTKRNENELHSSRVSQQLNPPTTSVDFAEINLETGDDANDLIAISTEHSENVQEQGSDSTYFDSNAQNGSSLLDVKPTVEEDAEDRIAYAHLFDCLKPANKQMSHQPHQQTLKNYVNLSLMQFSSKVLESLLLKLGILIKTLFFVMSKRKR